MIKIWDKKEEINGVSAEEYITSSPAWMINGDILLVVNDLTGVATEIHNVNQIRSSLKLDSSLDSLEVGEAYLLNLNTDIEPSEIEQLKKRIEEQETALVELAGLIGGNV